VLAHPAVKVFLSHGGMNSTNEGLAAGVPVLCMPFGGDQPINAQHIENKGVGLQVRAAGLGCGRAGKGEAGRAWDTWSRKRRHGKGQVGWPKGGVCVVATVAVAA
jgi:hypothetical protein